jgi:hypothetical protein
MASMTLSILVGSIKTALGRAKLIINEINPSKNITASPYLSHALDCL